MKKHQCQRHYLHLIVFTFFATLILPTRQSNITQSLRPFQTQRKLESPEPVACSNNVDFCIVQRKITKPETVYSFSVKPKVNFGLYLASDNDRDLSLTFEVEPFEGVNIFLHSYEASINHDERFYRGLYLQQKWTEVTVPGPIGDLQITFANQFSESPRVVTVTVSRSEIPKWVIPVAASVGGFVAILILALLYYRRRRLNRQNRQRRNAEAVPRQYQVVELGSPPPSPRQARQEANRNRRQQPQSLPKPTIQEIIDICYPEANFAQFESSFPQKTCTVCLDDMQENQPCRQLECQHIFHTKCAKQWLENQYKNKKKVFCPNCNKRVSLNTKKKKKPLEAAKRQ